jgi:hypothetical protein
VVHRRDFNRIDSKPLGALNPKGQLAKFEGKVDRALQKIGADRSLEDDDALLPESSSQDGTRGLEPQDG